MLRGWFEDATAAGIPFCEYLSKLSKASLKGAESGDNRLISSTSNAGQSTSFAPSSDQLVAPGEASQFLADCAEECLACDVVNPPVQEDFLNCLLASDLCAEPIMAFQKFHGGYRR
jgi:hypothetical protein